MTAPVTALSPAHLKQTAPALIGARALSLILDNVFFAGMYLLYYGVVFSLGSALGKTGVGTVTVVSLILLLLILAAVIYFWVVSLWQKGATPGMKICGIVWARWSKPGAPGFNAILKRLLQSAISGATFGIANLVIYLVSRDSSGRFWFDRVSDIIVLDTRRGNNPLQQLTVVSSLQTKMQQPGYGQYAALSTQPPATSSPWNDDVATITSQTTASEPPSSEAEPSFDANLITEVPWGLAETSAPATAAPSAQSVTNTGEVSVPADSELTEQTVARPLDAGQLQLVLDSGERIMLTSTVLIGRAPAAIAPWEDAILVPVSDTDRSISKTHLALRLSDGNVQVQDLGSTNGTVVILADGTSVPVMPSTNVIATIGSTVRFGERTLTITR